MPDTKARRAIALRVAIVYFVAAAAWIVLSDIALFEPAWDRSNVVVGSIAKGLLFCAVTALILYFSLARMLRAREIPQDAVDRKVLERHLDLMSRYANDIILLLDPASRIIEANDRALSRYGHPREKLLQMSAADLRPEGERAEVANHLADVLRTGGKLYETRHRRADGDVFPVEISARRVEVEGETYIQAIIRDISERKQAEARVAHLQRLRDAIGACNRAIVKARDDEWLFRKICQIVVERAGFPLAWIGVADRERNRVRPMARAGEPQGHADALEIPLDAATPEGRGLVAEAIRTGKPMVAQDYAGDPRLAPWHALAKSGGIRAMAAMPLRRAGEPIGSLNVYSRELNAFDDEYLGMLREIASDTSFALDSLQRERELATARERLDLATSGSGLAVWEMADTRDPASFWWSPGVYEMLGFGAGELPRNLDTILSLVNPDDHPALIAALQLAAESGETKGVEFRVRTKQGTERWYLARGRAVAAAGGGPQRIVGTFEDITGRKRTELDLHESEQRFRAVLDQSIAAVYMIQDGRIVYVNPRMREIFGYRAEDVFNPDPLAHVVESERAKVAEQMLLRLGSESTGAYSVAVTRKDGTPFTMGLNARRAMFQGKPAIIAIAQDITEKERAEEEVRRHVLKLEHAVQSTIEVVSKIGELRDPYTHGHERRVGEIASAIAHEMGLPADQIEGIRIAGYLHDVGKIAVPAEILSKPSRLSKAEFDLVKQHSQQSYEILKGVDFSWPVAEAAWQHHERLDGSGYPRGLKGEEIILEARILAVADTVEAMASHRPYRPGLGIDAALAEIEKQRARLFDPAVADSCLRLFREKGYALPA